MKTTNLCGLVRSTIVSLVLLPLGASQVFAQKTYAIAPVMFSTGYTVEGFIVTDGSTGSLTAANIVSYEVRVNGAVPFIFAPSNPNGRVSVGYLGGAVIASATSIILPLDADLGNPYQELNFDSYDGSAACFRQIRWTNNAFGGLPEGISGVEYTNSCGGPGPGGVFVNMTLPTRPQFVQTVAVANNRAFAGLFSPYAPPEQRQFRSGRTIPLKWQITEDDAAADSSAYPAAVSVVGPAQCGQTGGNPITVQTSGESGYRYDTATRTWSFNWNTSPGLEGCFTIVLEQPQLGLLKSYPIKLVR